MASCSKLQYCKITRETTQNANFQLRGPTPYGIFLLSHKLEWTFTSNHKPVVAIVAILRHPVHLVNKTLLHFIAFGLRTTVCAPKGWSVVSPPENT